MQPNTVHRLAVAVEDVLGAIVGPVDWPRFAVRELTLAELRGVETFRSLNAGVRETRRVASVRCTAWLGGTPDQLG